MFKPHRVSAATAAALVAALVTTVATFGTAQAQTAAPAAATKKELVAKVLQLQQPGVEAMARQLAEQPAAQMMQQAGALLQRVPTERRDALARDIEADVRKYVEEATPIVRERALKLAPSTIGPILEDRFTEDELRQIIVLLESPVNRKFQQLGPEMQKAFGEKLVAETRSDVEAKVRALDQSVGKRLGLQQPGGAASAPKAAPAPAKK